MIETYSNFLIANNGLAAVTRFSDSCGNLISHDKFTRFLNEIELTSKNLWQISKDLIAPACKNEKSHLVIDDSIIEKPYTKENNFNCWNFSHSKGRHLKGIGLITALGVFESAVAPVSYEIICKNVRYSDLKTKKEKRKSSRSKNEMARDMIKNAINNQLNFDYVLADSWFGSAETLDFIHKNHKKFIFGIKGNRLTFKTLEERESGIGVKLSELDLKENDVVPVFLNLLDFQVRVMKKVFTNEDGSQGILYLVTNDADLNAEDIYSTYQERWKIEVYHKSIKCNAGIASSPTKTIKSQGNHIFCSLYAFVKIESLKLKTNKNHFAIKRELHLYALKASRERYEEMMKLVS